MIFLMQQYDKCNILIPSNQNGLLQYKSQCLIVTTINPIWRSHPVHPGTKHLTICSLKSKKNIIFAHNFILKQNTNQASHCFDFICVYFSLYKD